MYYCVFNKSGKKNIGEIQSGNENQLTAQSILDKYCQGSNTLWLKTERYAYALKNDDHPFADHPNLILSSRPENDIPETALYAFSNYDPTSKVLYFLPKHDTIQKIPRLTIVVSQSDLESDLNHLTKLIEQSFISPANVLEIFINDQPLSGDVKINNVFEEAKNGKEISVSLTFDEECITKIRLRENLCNEIMYSENNYINDLTVINTDWKKMFEEENFLADTDFKAIFNDIPMILGIHTKFNDILKHFHDGYASQFSNCFLQYHPFFKGSINYITNYPNINEILKTKEEDPEVENKIKEMANQHKGRDFASFLITPVQRIPRYLLFLRELTKLTPPNHPDYLYLSQAVAVMTDLTKDIDKRTETAEKQNILYNIQLRNYTDFVYCQPARKVIKIFDTIIKERSLEGNLVVCDDYIFLIDKLDMWCRFKAPLNACPITFLNDGVSFKVLNTDEPDNLVETVVQMYSKDDLEEFKKMIGEASLNGFNSTKENDESLLWEVSPITEKSIPLCKHSGVYVKNKDEEYYLFYGGYTIKSEEQVDEEHKTYTYQQNTKIYCFTPPDQYKEFDSGIPGRYGHRLVYSNNKFFIIGGRPNSQNIYVYDNNQEGEQLGWKKVNAPELDLTGHTVVQHKNFLYIYGGSEYKDDVYELNTDDYSVKTYNDFPEEEKPEPRTNHSAVVYNNKFYIYGGMNYTGQPLSDMWSFDLETKKWEKKGQFYTQRTGHQGVLLGNEYVIVGGKPKGDTFSINLDTFEKKVVNDFGNYPAGLNGFAVAVGNDNTAVIYGGVESTSKEPKNTVYTIKLNDNWNQKVSQEETKNADLTAEKSQQEGMKPIINNFVARDIDGNENPANEDEIIDIGDSTSGLLESAGPGDGDLEPWALTPEEAEQLMKRLQEEEEKNANKPSEEQPAIIDKDIAGQDEVTNGDNMPWTVSPEDQQKIESGNQDQQEENQQQPEENKEGQAEVEITNGDDQPWTLTPEQAEELKNKKDEEEEKENQNQNQAEDQTPAEEGQIERGGPQGDENQAQGEGEGEAEAEAGAANEEGITNGDDQPWTLTPEQAEELKNKKDEEEEQQQPPTEENQNENQNPEEEATNQEWVVDPDKVNDIQDENKDEDLIDNGNQFEPDQNKGLKNGEEEEQGNLFEPDENKPNEEEQAGEGENQFEPDDDLANEIIQTEEEEGGENQNKPEEEENGEAQQKPVVDNTNEEEEAGGNQFEPDNKNEEEEIGGNQFEPDNKNEEEEMGGNQFEPDNKNEEEEAAGGAGGNGNQILIEEEEEEASDVHHNEEEQADQNDQQQNEPQHEEENNEKVEDNNSGKKQQHPSKKYQFHFEYTPTEEEDEDDQPVSLPKRKPEWPFEQPDDPPRKYSPIFYPETPGSQRRKKNQSARKKNNSSLSPTGGASGKPPIFNVSSNYDYYNNYNNNNNNNNNNNSFNNSFNNYSYSPFSPKKPRYSSPKSSLYPNVLDDVTPKRKLQAQIRQQQNEQQKLRQQRNQNDQNNSSQYTSSLSSSSVLSPNRQNQVRNHQQRQQHQNKQQPSSSHQRQQRQQRSNYEEEQLDQQSSSTVQSSSLLNSQSDKAYEIPPQQKPRQRQQQQKQQQQKPRSRDLSEHHSSSVHSSSLNTAPSEKSNEIAQQQSPSKRQQQQQKKQKSSEQSDQHLTNSAQDSSILLSDQANDVNAKQRNIEEDQNEQLQLEEEEKDEIQLLSEEEEEIKAIRSEESIEDIIKGEDEKASKKDKEKKKEKEKKKDKKDKDKKDKDKEKDKEKDKDKKKEKDKDKKKDKDKDKEKDKDRKDKDKKKDKKKENNKDKDRDEKHKSSRKDDEKHRSHHNHRNDHSHDSSKGHSPRQQPQTQTQSRSDINNMTKTNDTMPIMFDTSPIKNPNQESRNINTNINTNNNNNNNNRYEPLSTNKNLRTKGNPYLNYNKDKDNDKENVIRRRRRFNDDSSNNNNNSEEDNSHRHHHRDALSFKRKPTFKRTAQNHFNFNNDKENNRFDFDSSSEFSGAHYGGFDQFDPSDFNKEGSSDSYNNYNNYFNFRIRGSGPNFTNTTNVQSSNSPYKARFNHRPTNQGFVAPFTIPQEQINCSYLPKFNIYGNPIYNNNNYYNNNNNANPYLGGGAAVAAVGGYKPTNYRRDHARVNVNNRYNVIDDTFDFSSNSNQF